METVNAATTESQWKASFPNLTIPSGLSFEDVQAAALYIHEWQEDDEPSAVPVVIKVFEHLVAASANRKCKG